jgi:hypothetical protein
VADLTQVCPSQVYDDNVEMEAFSPGRIAGSRWIKLVQAGLSQFPRQLMLGALFSVILREGSRSTSIQELRRIYTLYSAAPDLMSPYPDNTKYGYGSRALLLTKIYLISVTLPLSEHAPQSTCRGQIVYIAIRLWSS